MSDHLQPIQPPAENLELDKKPKSLSVDEQARAEAVGELLTKAYAAASTLQLTPNESKALRVDFPDHAVRGGAKGEANLLYISHIYLSDRLNDVLGIGQWCLVKRNQRAEQTKTRDGKPLIRIYYEGVLLIRGAFVTEAIGVGQYHPNNPKEDYGTGLESAMSDCLTRCCKRLGIGSQTWDKSFCDDWNQKFGGRRPIKEPRSTDDPPEKEAEPESKQDNTETQATPQGSVETVDDFITGVQAAKGKLPYRIETKSAGVFKTEDTKLANEAGAILKGGAADARTTLHFVTKEDGQWLVKLVQ